MSIDPNPKQPPCYSPSEERYWNSSDLDQEIHRIFDICHSCRMCLSYCPSFPDLFARIDRSIEQEKATGAEALNTEDIRAVVDLCYQCKLCYIKCPYTEDEGHAWKVDFPRIALREKALRAQRDGVTLQDQMLGEPQLLGALTAGPQARIANFVNAQSLVRKGIETVVGISSKFPIPTFVTEPFPAWFKKHRQHTVEIEPIHGEVVLFSTCYGNYNTTGPTIAAVRVLEAHGVKVHYAKGQACCGMPNLDGGNIPNTIEKAKQNIEVLLPYVKRGCKVVIPGPTCSYVLSKEYAELIGTEDARQVAKHSMDLMKWIDVELRRKKKLKRDIEWKFGKVAYHTPCHLRAQKIAFPAVQILESLGIEVEVIQECSAVDGTWGMKVQYYELGRRYAQKMIHGMRDAEAKIYISDCPLSGLRIQHELGVQCMHPIEALAMAYGVHS